jgi:hypothetical protein
MAEPTQIAFPYKEVVAALLKQQNIHEGIWGIYVKFAIQAINSGPTKDELRPTAVVPVVEIGLQKYEEVNGLSVDASKANPAIPQKMKSGKAK